MPEDNKQMHFLDAETAISARLPRAWAAVSRRIAELEEKVKKCIEAEDRKILHDREYEAPEGRDERGPYVTHPHCGSKIYMSENDRGCFCGALTSIEKAALAAEEARNAK